MFGHFGPWELIVILLIVVIVFGVGRLPELGTGLGQGIRNFRKAYKEPTSIDLVSGDEKKPEETK